MIEKAQIENAVALQTRVRSIPAVLTFIILAFVWSWGMGIAANYIGKATPVLNTALKILAGFGPSLAGIVVVASFSTGTGLCDWLMRCLNWRVGWKWCLLAFGFPPAVMIVAIGLHRLLGGPMPALMSSDHIPLAIMNYGIVFLIGGPIGEEFGWRGYLMPALTPRMDWRVASLLIGIIWGLWHLPLFFLTSTPQAQMPMLVFFLNILAGSVVFSWLFERTQGSILPALVLHTSLNAWTGMLGIVPTAATSRPYLLVTGLLILIALILLATPSPASEMNRNQKTKRSTR